MTVKQYLSQLKKIDAQIEQLIEEKGRLESQLMNTTVAPKEIQVMSSLPADPMADRVARIVDIEHELDIRTDHLIDLRNMIIRQIHKLDDPLMIQILYKRYVEYKRWDIIEAEMNYSFQHLQRLHKKALWTFGVKHEIK